MKKYIKYLVLVLLMFTLTGCNDYGVEMTLNKDKSVDLFLTITRGNLVETEYTDNNFDTLKEIFEDRGYDVEIVNLDNFDRLEISKRIKNIDRISTKEKTVVDLTKFTNRYFDETTIFQKKWGLFKNTYIASFIYDPSSVDNISPDEPQKAFVLNIPFEITSTNAIKVDEDTLTWIIDPKEKTEINFSIQYYNAYLKYLIGIIVIGLILIIAKYLFKKKNLCVRLNNDS